jgi:hypothetical protein
VTLAPPRPNKQTKKYKVLSISIQWMSYHIDVRNKATAFIGTKAKKDADFRVVKKKCL